MNCAALPDVSDSVSSGVTNKQKYKQKYKQTQTNKQTSFFFALALSFLALSFLAIFVFSHNFCSYVFTIVFIVGNPTGTGERGEERADETRHIDQETAEVRREGSRDGGTYLLFH